ncbi:MAG: hypothetical protein U0166_11100 [Acidobacteriota bacterium]
MKRTTTLLATSFLLAAPLALDTALAEGTPSPAIFRGASSAVRFDVSPPLRSLPPVVVPIPPEPECMPDDEDFGYDVTGPSNSDTAVQTQKGVDAMPPTAVSFQGFGSSGALPPDPVGAVGPSHYVAMANSRFAVYDKTGTLLYGPAANRTLWTGFGGPCEVENAGDPVVLHDRAADRWMLTQFTAAGPQYYNCMAVSTTPDPTGTYYRYAFISASSSLPDYPKYGVWPDAYYISARELGGTPPGIAAYAAERSEILVGNPAAQLLSFLVPVGSVGRYLLGDGWLPSDMDGATPPPAGSPNYYLGTMDGGINGAPQDAVYMWKFHVDWTTPANSTFTQTNTIPAAPFDTIFPCGGGRNCIPQPGTAQKIDILSYRQRPLFRAAYRNFGTHESIVTNQSVEAATALAGIRWFEIRDPNGTPTIYQQGTYAPGTTDGIHRWMGSIAMDQDGNMALGFSASDATATFPSVWYTGRLATDALGTMPQGEGSIVDGLGSQTSATARWGDYSAMTLDPTDDCTFWYINEYYLTTSGGSWRLRVGAFKYPGCGSTGPTSNVDVVTGPGPGNANPPNVKGYNADGTSNGITNFNAYAVSQYGANVALANVRTSTAPFATDILTGPGPGAAFGPQVKGFARDGAPIGKINFYAYGTLKYGVNASSGDLDGDSYEEIVTAPGPGPVFGPHIRGWQYDNTALSAMAKISFFAFSTLKYGAQITGGEIDGDSFAEMLACPGPSGAFGSQVRGFNYDNATVAAMAKVNFFPYTTMYGAHAATGDLDKDGIEEILAAPGPDATATSRVRGYNYDGASIVAISGIDFDAVPGANRYGTTIDSVDLDNDSWAEIVAGTGYDPTGSGTTRFKGWNYDQAAIAAIAGLDVVTNAGLAYGVNVAVDEVGP